MNEIFFTEASQNTIVHTLPSYNFQPRKERKLAKSKIVFEKSYFQCDFVSAQNAIKGKK